MCNLVDNKAVGEDFFVGEDRSIIYDPEHGGWWRLGANSALEIDISVAEVRSHRAASYLRRILKKTLKWRCVKNCNDIKPITATFQLDTTCLNNVSSYFVIEHKPYTAATAKLCDLIH